jgi:hypothetical protein
LTADPAFIGTKVRVIAAGERQPESGPFRFSWLTIEFELRL